MKKTVFRKNDLVKIINPVLVERVGYPLTIQKVIDECFSKEEEQKIEEFLRFFKCTSERIFEVKPNRTRVDIIHAIASAKLRQLGWGGKERSLHLHTVESLKDTEVYICKKKVVQTGTYFAPSGGYDSWTGEYDSEPGGLDNRKSHILLGFYPATVHPTIKTKDDIVWIEEKNVELITSYYKWDEA